MKLKTVAVVLLSLSIGFIVGPLIAVVYLSLNHVELRGNYPVVIIGLFIELFAGLSYLLACEIDAHTDLDDEEVSIW